MASKTTKKTTVTQSSSSITQSKKSGSTSRSSTPQQQQPAQASSASASASSARPQSPGLSPTRFSRLQEKADLQNLNDRLACYIDRVRQLESENSGLRREVQTSEETTQREVTTIKSMYEKELGDARRLLDETARDRAKLEIDAKRLFEENNDQRIKLEKKTKDLALAERAISTLEPQNAALSAKYNQAVADRKKAEDAVKELEKELEKIRKTAAELRKELETETLLRVDLENNLQSVKEDRDFKEQIHKNQMTETRTRRQVEISEIDGRLSEAYEAKLQQSLQELRDQYEAQMHTNRDEIESLYDRKLQNAQSLASRNSDTNTSLLDANRQYRIKVDAYAGRISELESTNAGLLTRIADLEQLMANERDSSFHQRQLLENELKLLQEEMAKQLQEYQDLMDIRVALDLEIAAYRTLLESEEARLNISPMQSPRATPSRRTPVYVRGGKRKRMDESSESSSQFQVRSQSTGDVEISEVCPEGTYVRLFNKGDKEVSLSGWQLICEAGNLKTVYKFHRTAKLDAGTTVTVWSSDSKTTHEPPSNLVMKGQKWVVADASATVLKNAAGDEMALSERKLQTVSHSRHRETAGFLAGQRLTDELYQQHGEHREGEERCSIM